MTDNELTLGLDSETNAPPIKSFVLAEPEGRADFLWHLSEAGEEALIEATAHVWNSLAAPRGTRCSAMAQELGLSGKGKVGLYNVLKTFLEDFERKCDPPPLPERIDFASSVDWHAAVGAHFAAGDIAMERVISRYSGILNGETMVNPQPDGSLLVQQEATKAVVLKGPWRKVRPSRPNLL